MYACQGLLFNTFYCITCQQCNRSIQWSNVTAKSDKAYGSVKTRIVNSAETVTALWYKSTVLDQITALPEKPLLTDTHLDRIKN